MSNDPDARDRSEVNPFTGRVKANLREVVTAVRQFWEGYLSSPNGC